MNNTNTKVICIGGMLTTAATAAKLLIDELDNEVNVLDQLQTEVFPLHMYPPEMPACYKVTKNPSWSEMNKGKLSKRARRK